MIIPYVEERYIFVQILLGLRIEDSIVVLIELLDIVVIDIAIKQIS